MFKPYIYSAILIICSSIKVDAQFEWTAGGGMELNWLSGSDIEASPDAAVSVDDVPKRVHYLLPQVFAALSYGDYRWRGRLRAQGSLRGKRRGFMKSTVTPFSEASQQVLITLLPEVEYRVVPKLGVSVGVGGSFTVAEIFQRNGQWRQRPGAFGYSSTFIVTGVTRYWRRFSARADLSVGLTNPRQAAFEGAAAAQLMPDQHRWRGASLTVGYQLNKRKGQRAKW